MSAKIKTAEWRFVFLVAAALMIVTTLPLLYGWLLTRPGTVFTGIHFAAPNDWFVYYSYIEQARDGHLLFRDLFASESHLPTFNIFWLSVGLLARIGGLSAMVALNLVRLILIPVLFWVIYQLLAEVFASVFQRRLALFLMAFSSGSGLLLLNRIILYPFNFANGQFNWPMDLWVPEAITFLTAYYSPHFIASLILIMAIFLLAIRHIKAPTVSRSIIAGLLALLLFSFHPFHILTVLGVLAVYSIVMSWQQRQIHWSSVIFSAIVMIISLPAIGYYLYLLQSDWLTAQKAIQNITLTPPLWITMFSYGLLLAFAMIGVAVQARRREIKPAIFFVLVWLGTQALLLYAPVNYQRRMSEGWHVPLTILATMGIVWLWNLVLQRQTAWQKLFYVWRYTVALMVATFLVSSNVFLVAADLYLYTDGRSMAYINTDLVAAGQWLRSSGRQTVVFNSANNIINSLPAYCDCSVYVGHGVETPYFGRKQDEVSWFFARDRSQMGEQTFLKRRGVTYLLFGPGERAFGSYAPQSKSYLRAVYTNSTISIFQVL